MKHAAIAICYLLMVPGLAQAFETPAEVVHIQGHPVARADLIIETDGGTVPEHYHAAIGTTVNPLDGSMALTDPGGIEGYGLVSALSTGSFLSALGFTGADQLSILTALSPEQATAQTLFNLTFAPLFHFIKLVTFLNQIQPLLTMGIVAGPDFTPEPGQSNDPPGGSTPGPADQIPDLRNKAKALRQEAAAHDTAMEQLIQFLGPGTDWAGGMIPLPNGEQGHDALVDEYMKHRNASHDLTLQAGKLDKQADTLVAQAGKTQESPPNGPTGSAPTDTTPPSQSAIRVKALQDKLQGLDSKVKSLKSQATTTKAQGDKLNAELDAITTQLGLPNQQMVLELMQSEIKMHDKAKTEMDIGKKILFDTFKAGYSKLNTLAKTEIQLENSIEDTKAEITQLNNQGIVLPLQGNGSIQTFPDGREILTLPHGAGKIEGSPDGTHTITGPNGTWRTTTLPSGKSRMTLKDGTTITTFPASDPAAKGSTKIKVVKADQSGWIQDADGNILKTFP